MKKLKFVFVLFMVPFLWSFGCSKNQINANIETAKNNTTQQKSVSKDSLKNLPDGLQQLIIAYPDYLDRADEKYLYWKDGTKMLWDDGKSKSHDDKLDNADLEDMMSQEYVTGKNWDEPPAVNYEPGRIRCTEFFEKMYGGSQSEVSRNLTTINWFGTSVQVTKVNGVDQQFKEVAKELEKLPQEFHKYFNKTAGTFNYRKIAGTSRTSAHSYGIAIDINTAYSDYWQWNKSMKYTNRIPVEVAEVFERFGFIWGAKWYHYDTMHFEFRPELIVRADKK